jgi:hypothetical protein
VVTGVSSTQVAHGGTVEVRGFNLGPIDGSLKVRLKSDDTAVTDVILEPIKPSAGTNGFNSVRVQIPDSYRGPATLVVTTAQGSSGTLAAGRINVQ